MVIKKFVSTFAEIIKKIKLCDVIIIFFEHGRTFLSSIFFASS